MKLDIIENLKLAIINSHNSNDSLQNKFLQLIENQPSSFYGRSEQSHITSSVLVMDENHENVLLTHHKKFNKWIQLGGHWMDTPGLEETVFHGGMREVFEEAYGNKPVEYKALNNQKPLNIDIHPAGKDIHYDICYLVEIKFDIPCVISHESNDIQWISIEQILDNKNKFDERLVNMISDAKRICLKPKKISL